MLEVIILILICNWIGWTNVAMILGGFIFLIGFVAVMEKEELAQKELKKEEPRQ